MNFFTPSPAHIFFFALLASSNKEFHRRVSCFFPRLFQIQRIRLFTQIAWLRSFLEKKVGGTSPGEKQGMHENVLRNVQENDISVIGDGGLR